MVEALARAHGSSSRHPAYKIAFARRVETIYAQE